MEPSAIPQHLPHAREHVERFQSIAKKYGYTTAQTAISFALQRCPAQHVVFGVETLQQLEDDIQVSAREPDDKLLKELAENFESIERAIVNPSLWSKK